MDGPSPCQPGQEYVSLVFRPSAVSQGIVEKIKQNEMLFPSEMDKIPVPKSTQILKVIAGSSSTEPVHDNSSAKSCSKAKLLSVRYHPFLSFETFFRSFMIDFLACSAGHHRVIFMISKYELSWRGELFLLAHHFEFFVNSVLRLPLWYKIAIVDDMDYTVLDLFSAVLPTSAVSQDADGSSLTEEDRSPTIRFPLLSKGMALLTYFYDSFEIRSNGDNLAVDALNSLSAQVVLFHKNARSEALIKSITGTERFFIPQLTSKFLAMLVRSVSQFIDLHRSVRDISPKSRHNLRISNGLNYGSIISQFHIDSRRMINASSLPLEHFKPKMKRQQTAQSKSFLQMICPFLKKHGIRLSRRDKNCLSKTFKYDHFFPYNTWKCKHGVYIHESENLSKRYPHILEFYVCGVSTKISVDTTCLSAAGISFLFWALPPSPEFVEPLVRIMRTVNFSNCLIDKVLVQRREGLPHECITIPEPWMNWLGISDSFMEGHGALHDLAVTIGMPNRQVDENISIFRRIAPSFFKITKNEEPVDEGVHEEPTPTPRIDHTVPRRFAKSLDNCDEYFYIDESSRDEYKIKYQSLPKRNFTVSSVSASVKVAGTGASAMGAVLRTPESQVCHENLGKGYPLWLRSLSQLLTLELESTIDGQPIHRMQWLGRLLAKTALFPLGENTGFIDSVLAHVPKPERLKMFPRDDLKVNEEALLTMDKVRFHFFKEDDRVSILFTENLSTGGVELYELTGKLQKSESIIKIRQYKKVQHVPSYFDSTQNPMQQVSLG